MWFNILGFWAVGFTTGWALTFKAHMGLFGIWLGILSGVSTTGILWHHGTLRGRINVVLCKARQVQLVVDTS